jgi:hypothetical protein
MVKYEARRVTVCRSQPASILYGRSLVGPVRFATRAESRRVGDGKAVRARPTARGGEWEM